MWIFVFDFFLNVMNLDASFDIRHKMERKAEIFEHFENLSIDLELLGM